MLFWDFDGTLAIRDGGWRASLAAVLARELPEFAQDADYFGTHLRSGFPWHSPENAHPELRDPAAWWAFLTPVFTKAFQSTGCTFSQALELAHLVREEHLQPLHWTTAPDAIQVLEELSEQGWRHAIVSNHVPELSALVDGVGLAPHFDAVFTSALTGYEKPHPRSFQIAAKSLGITQAEWMIGDSYVADYEGSLSAGIPNAVLVGSRSIEDGVLCVTSLKHLPSLIGTPAIRPHNR